MHFLSIQRFNPGNELPLYTSAAVISGAPHSSAAKLKFESHHIIYDNGNIAVPLNNNIKVINGGVYRVNFSATAKINNTQEEYDGSWWAQITINNEEKCQVGAELGPIDSNDRFTASSEIIYKLNANDIIDVRLAPEGIMATVTAYAISINVQQLT